MRSIEFGPGFVGGLVLLLLTPFVAGCGASSGKVSGRVMYGGKPLPGGRVTFRPADPGQNSVSAELDGQGDYRAVLPVGEVRVCVDNQELEPSGPIGGALPPDLSPELRKLLGGEQPGKSPPKAPEGAPERPAGRYVKIPDRYYQVETSGLHFTVKRGEQRYDIELEK